MGPTMICQKKFLKLNTVTLVYAFWKAPGNDVSAVQCDASTFGFSV